MKFPLIILLTTAGNALLHAMLAPLLGLRISLHQSLSAMLLSFTIAAALLASFSPLVFFLVWNCPPMIPSSVAGHLNYNLILLLHVGLIALSGGIANLRLASLLAELSGNATVARRVLVAWLAGNFFLGSQVSWILRPFIWITGSRGAIPARRRFAWKLLRNGFQFIYPRAEARPQSLYECHGPKCASANSCRASLAATRRGSAGKRTYPQSADSH